MYTYIKYIFYFIHIFESDYILSKPINEETMQNGTYKTL